MLFAWLRRRRRRQLLAQPFPSDWLRHLEENVAHYQYLTGEEQAKLRDDLRVFVAEKSWEGCGGLEITDEMKVTVAALACLLTLHLEEGCYDRILTMLVYPEGYRAQEETAVGPGLVLEGVAERLGEAHYRGAMVLSWSEVLEDARHPGDGRNLVFHEFAHQLDMLDGAIDGTPPLRDRKQYRRWRRVMTAAYRELIRDTERGRRTLLDPYGTTNEAEFFAVCTECFFDQPVELRDHHPELYDVLADYYRQDPASWFEEDERANGEA